MTDAPTQSPVVQASSNKKHHRLSGGDIAGIVIGSVVFAILVVLLVYFLCIREEAPLKGFVGPPLSSTSFVDINPAKLEAQEKGPQPSTSAEVAERNTTVVVF